MSTTPSVPATPSDPGGLPVLAIQDLACRRGQRRLFSGVSFDVRPGTATWLRGRNGRGKTSLLRLAAGLATPEAGAVTWGGVPVRRAPDLPGRRVYIGHASALKDDLTLSESLRFLAALHGRPDDAASVRAALDGMGLGARVDAPVRTLSQGQRRRGALARLALERQAALWILDEPYDALDTDGLAAVNRLLREHLARGGSALLTSHQHVGADAPPMAEFDLDACA